MARYKVGSDGWHKRAQSRHGNRTSSRPFAGCDGEGGTRDGVHSYFYIRAGGEELYNENGDPLGTAQILEFLSHLPNNFNYVGYFFDYDVTMILRDLPHERVGKLLNPEVVVGAQGRPITLGVDWQGYQLWYRPGKEFKVRWRDGKVYGPTICINDVGSFFQCTFVRALNQWLGEWDSVEDDYVIRDERDRKIVDRIAEGKSKRSEFHGLDEYIRQYCQLECEQLARMMENFRHACRQVGLSPTRWQGPGYLVSAAMRMNGFPKNKEYREKVPLRVWELAQAAYYGGRFEAPIIGRIEGPVYQYDINSAYAGSYRHLPCLIHGLWTPGKPKQDNYPIGTIVRVRFNHKPSEHLCSLPVRDKKGCIFFPHKGQGVYWWFEASAAENRAHVVVDEAWCYERRCDCSPFAWIDALYERRISVGKKTGMGSILKLVLASTYGKLCQSIGSAPYSNPVWASFITSYVRTQLYRAAIEENDGRDVVMLATDGLFTRRNRPGLRVSKEIGEWECDVHDSMFVVQSGLYFLPDKKPKTRGVPRVNVERQRDGILSAWDEFLPILRAEKRPDRLEPPTCPIYLDQFIAITLGYARGDVRKAGQWLIEHERQLTFDWRAKRTTHGRAILVGDSFVTIPHKSSRREPNHPYSKSIGGIVGDDTTGLTINDINDGQPDWNTFTLGMGT